MCSGAIKRSTANATVGGLPPNRSSISTKLQNTVSTANAPTMTVSTLRGVWSRSRAGNSLIRRSGNILCRTASSNSSRHSNIVWRLNQL